jgi:hypothetical protein
LWKRSFAAAPTASSGIVARLASFRTAESTLCTEVNGYERLSVLVDAARTSAEHLRNAGDASAAYLTRHAIAQVEQNVMAEQPDDLLRQQTGILFACVKPRWLSGNQRGYQGLAGEGRTARARKVAASVDAAPCAVEAALAALGQSPVSRCSGYRRARR